MGGGAEPKARAAARFEFRIEANVNEGEALYRLRIKVEDGKVRIPHGPDRGVAGNPRLASRREVPVEPAAGVECSKSPAAKRPSK